MLFIKSLTAAIIIALLDILFLAWCFCHVYDPTTSIGATILLDIGAAIAVSHFFLKKALPTA
jgi:hypothetical protein